MEQCYISGCDNDAEYRAEAFPAGMRVTVCDQHIYIAVNYFTTRNRPLMVIPLGFTSRRIMFAAVKAKLHEIARQHRVVHNHAIAPTRMQGGIAIYEQHTFRPAIAHWRCQNCRKIWF